MYILATERDRDVEGAFSRYRQFLQNNSGRFPPNAYELASSDWYYNFDDHRCPHDSWLEEFSIRESATGERNEIRSTEISIRLLGAYHDGFIELRYENVCSYMLKGASVSDGHSDWRYDEFRLTNDGRLVHEIEWCGLEDTAVMEIVSRDVQFSWLPK